MTTAATWGAVCLVLTLLLSRLWLRLGWGDAARGPERARKLQHGAVPAVGGLAIAIVWLAQAGLDDSPWSPAVACVAVGMAVALVSGMLDDWREAGLRPRTKLLFQALAGACLGTVAAFPEGPGGALDLGPASLAQIALMGFLATVFLNGMNTFDNADGAVGAVAGTGLLLAASPLAPALLAFLIPNLLLRRSRGTDPASKGVGDPLAYLGDGGSQLIGLALLATPAARPALLLPLLDLLWVSVVRLRLGIPPWVGDRRHLAHRLQRRGLGPLAVAALLTVIALPALVFSWKTGATSTALLYLGACLWTRSSEEGADSGAL